MSPAYKAGDFPPAHLDFFAALRLRHTPEIGSRTIKNIAAAYGSFQEALEDFQNWRKHGLAREVQLKNLQAGHGLEEARDEYRAFLKTDFSVLTWHDPAYPALLREIPDAPAYLYLRGDTELISAPLVAVVGSRGPSRFGIDTARRISKGLAEAGICVVSGMALGVDREAHLAALSGKGRSIAVLANGLDIVYPLTNFSVFKELCQNGLVISEYGPGERPRRGRFPVRNRIISGLCAGVVVCEAGLRSGALITARLSMEFGREVMAAPGPPSIASCLGSNSLLRDGAALVQSAEDVLFILREPLLQFLSRRSSKTGQQNLISTPLAGVEQKRASLDREPLLPMDFLNKSPITHQSILETKNKPALSTRLPKSAQNIPEPMDLPLPRSLTIDEKAILGLLSSGSCLYVDEIVHSLGLESAQVGRALAGLEILGLIRRQSGMRYSSV